MKYKVKYFTEFGTHESIVEESTLVAFIYRFKVSSIKAIVIDDVVNSVCERCLKEKELKICNECYCGSMFE